jgi:hypothetical protein
VLSCLFKRLSFAHLDLTFWRCQESRYITTQNPEPASVLLQRGVRDFLRGRDHEPHLHGAGRLVDAQGALPARGHQVAVAHGVCNARHLPGAPPLPFSCFFHSRKPDYFCSFIGFQALSSPFFRQCNTYRHVSSRILLCNSSTVLVCVFVRTIQRERLLLKACSTWATS